MALAEVAHSPASSHRVHPMLELMKPSSFVLINSDAGMYESLGEEYCQLLGDAWGLLMQFVLFCVCMWTLLFKWYLEVPRRRFLVFLLDSSKQIIGSGYLHFANMGFAMLVDSTDAVRHKECAWYWANLVSDCTLGLLIVWIILRLSERCFHYKSGLYSADQQIDWEAQPDYSRWAGQVSVYLLILSIKKLIVGALLWFALPFSVNAGRTATTWVGGPHLQLLFTMVLTPVVMDTFSFWMTDGFLKHHSHSCAPQQVANISGGHTEVSNMHSTSLDCNDPTQ